MVACWCGIAWAVGSAVWVLWVRSGVTKGNHTSSYVVIGRRMSGLSVLVVAACAAAPRRVGWLSVSSSGRDLSELVVGVLEWAEFWSGQIWGWP
jgi:hypothetical protein